MEPTTMAGVEGNGNRRILIVDDEKDFANSLEDILSSSGYLPRCAFNAEDGMQAFFRFDPRAVLLDIRLGRSNGLDLLSRFRKERPQVPCLLMTAFSDVDTSVRALSEGASGYLLKPFRPDELLTILDHLFAKLDLEEEKRAAETALRASEERFRQIFMQEEDAVVLLDPETLSILDLNPSASRLFSLARKDALGKTPTLFLDPPSFRALKESLGGLPTERATTIPSLKGISPAGTELTLSARLFHVGLEEGQVLFCSLRDIGPRLKMEEESRFLQATLIQASKMSTLGQMVSVFAHEINNPSNTIMFNTHLLGEMLPGVIRLLDERAREKGEFSLGGLAWPEAREALPRLLGATHEASAMICGIMEDLKHYVRPASLAEEKKIDLNLVVEKALRMLRVQASREGVPLETDLARSLPPVAGHPQKLVQVLVNLLANALEARAGRCHEVLIRTRSEGRGPQGKVVVEVRDNGRGMSEEQRERAFEPFFSTRLEEGGTGLGLPIVRSIVREHGGEISIESEEGKGTVVRIAFPPSAGALPRTETFKKG